MKQTVLCLRQAGLFLFAILFLVGLLTARDLCPRIFFPLVQTGLWHGIVEAVGSGAERQHWRGAPAASVGNIGITQLVAVMLAKNVAVLKDSEHIKPFQGLQIERTLAPIRLAQYQYTKLQSRA